MASISSHVFVYGTLTDPEQVDALLADWQFDTEVVLEGCHRVDGDYPTLAPGGRTAGTLLITPELDTLDAYEGVDRGLYVRVAIPLDRGGTAWVYVGDPDRLDAPADWPREGPFRARVERYVERADVRIRRRGNR